MRPSRFSTALLQGIDLLSRVSKLIEYALTEESDRDEHDDRHQDDDDDVLGHSLTLFILTKAYALNKLVHRDLLFPVTEALITAR